MGTGKDISVATKLALFVADLELKNLPPDVVEKAKCCLLYGLGIGLCSFQTPFPSVAARAAEMIQPDPGGRATIWFDGRKSSVNTSIIANAALLHGRCQEDTCGVAHFGVMVFPLLMGLLETQSTPMNRLLPALLAGYEVGGYLESLFSRKTFAQGFRGSCMYGTFATTAAACKLLNLSPEVTRSAFAHAAAFTGGTFQSIAEGSDEWRYQVGIASSSGLVAAELARAGAIGGVKAFDGKQGFAQAFAKTEIPESFGDRLGSEWQMRRVSFKPYPVCAHNMSVVTAALRLRDQVDPDQIEHCDIYIDPFINPGMDFQGPFSSVSQTLLSTSFCASAALARGRVDIAEMNAFDDPAIMSLVPKMALVLNPELAFPACKLIARLRSGKTIVQEERTTARDYDLTRRQIGAQLRRMAVYNGVPETAIAKLENFVDQLPHSNVNDVTEAFAQVRSAQSSKQAGAL